jgi:hypothetical protein
MSYKPVVKDRPISADTNMKWSEKQRMDAVNSYLLLGNLALTSRVLNIPEVTLRYWKAQPWWKDAVTEIKSSEKMQLSVRVKKLVDASLAVVEDRLINGDFQFDQKTGAVVRKPVNLKDAHKVAIDMADKHEALEKSEEVVQKEENVDDKLLRLAEKFATMATLSVQNKIDTQRTVENVADITDVQEVSSNKGH